MIGTNPLQDSKLLSLKASKNTFYKNDPLSIAPLSNTPLSNTPMSNAKSLKESPKQQPKQLYKQHP